MTPVVTRRLVTRAPLTAPLLPSYDRCRMRQKPAIRRAMVPHHGKSRLRTCERRELQGETGAVGKRAFAHADAAREHQTVGQDGVGALHGGVRAEVDANAWRDHEIAGFVE